MVRRTKRNGQKPNGAAKALLSVPVWLFCITFADPSGVATRLQRTVHSTPRARLASFPTRPAPTPGLLKGQTARQIAQLSASLKYGRHLSKSTYQRFSPRTSAFS